MITGALITGGIMTSYWIDFAFFFAPGQISWRFPVAFQILFAIGLLTCVLSLPESPRWLVKQERYEDAALVLSSLEDCPLDDPVIVAAVQEIKDALVSEEGSESAGAVKLMATQGKKKHAWRTSLAVWNQIFQQISGTNLIIYYAATIYETSIGLSPINSKVRSLVATLFFALCLPAHLPLRFSPPALVPSTLSRPSSLFSSSTRLDGARSCCGELSVSRSRWRVSPSPSTLPRPRMPHLS